MKTFFKYVTIIVLLIILMVVKAALEQDMKNRNQNALKSKQNKITQIKEITPNNDKLIIPKGKSNVVLKYNKRKKQSPTSIKVYTVNKDDKELDITMNGKLSSSPFQWSIKDSQSNLKSTLGDHLRVELSYNGDEVTKNYKVEYKK